MAGTTDRFMRLILGEWKKFRESHFGSGEESLRDPEVIASFLLSRRGEASGAVLAQRLFDAFEAAAPEAQLEFFSKLAQRFGADAEKLQQAIQTYGASPGDATALAVHHAAEPRRQELIRRLNYSSGGTFRLVKMRERLLGFKREHPELAAVDADFAHLFTSWFNPGFLEVRPITWRTPASVLEKLIRYEAVHTIRGWDDLRGRLDPVDRRCFGFFHPQLTDEPLIFVEVALTRDGASSIQALLDTDRAPVPLEDATTAVFYSISNTQKGLAGVPFGSFLLKHAIEVLKREIPNLTTFVTLSPVPGFAKWLANERAADKSEFLAPQLLEMLKLLDAPDWQLNAAQAERVRPALLDSVARYLLLAKTASGRPVNAVARFHLRNGAALHRVHFLADTSAHGMKQAHGLMVNYLYVLEDVEKNHEAFVERGEIAASREVKTLLEKPMKPLKGRERSRA